MPAVASILALIFVVFPFHSATAEENPDKAEETEASSAPSTRAYWKEGFRIEHIDQGRGLEFKFRFRTGMEFRYTYALTDGKTEPSLTPSSGVRLGNDDDYNAFNMRRLRFYVDGTAPTPDWHYFVHVQLEPDSGVNAHDAYAQWQRWRALRIQFGRMKVPAYGLEFWQSGFKLNGTDRTIFSGDSENDKDLFGTRTYDFPSGNARLRVGNQLLANGFSPGGFTLYRSQGLNLNGELDLLDRRQLLAYWLGVYNGRDSRGLETLDEEMLFALRVGLNFLPGSDPTGPLGPGGLDGYTMQGDFGNNTRPLSALVLSTFWDHQRPAIVFTPKGWVEKDGERVLNDANGFMGSEINRHDIENYGVSATWLFRWRGFSSDLESAWEEFRQDPGGQVQETWSRWGVRLNLGQFIVPKKWEITAKFAHVVRLEDNDLEESLRSGLGLVDRDQGWGLENFLQEYRIGVNWYLYGYSQMLSADVAWLRVDLDPVSRSQAEALLGLTPGEAAELFPRSLDAEDAIRFRVMYQFLF